MSEPHVTELYPTVAFRASRASLMASLTQCSEYRAQSIRSGFDMSKVLTYDNPTHFCLMRRTVIMPGPLPKYAITLTAAQAMHLQHLSTCYTTPYAEVQRARILLLAHQHPTWRNAEIARRADCCVNTVKRWRPRWQPTDA